MDTLRDSFYKKNKISKKDFLSKLTAKHRITQKHTANEQIPVKNEILVQDIVPPTESNKLRESSSSKNAENKMSLTPLQEKLKQRLDGARFRWLNEKLYKSKGSDMFKLFKEEPELYDLYHTGFQSQVSKWPVNPVDVIIKKIQALPRNFVIGDFGCGEAKISQTVKNTVHSFDLHSPPNSNIIACDIANVPLKNDVLDVGVFCLSLMGTNFTDYLKEANRVLKMNGLLLVAEVESRIVNLKIFIATLSEHGFQVLDTNTKNKMFTLFEFKKVSNSNKNASSSTALKPCLYKKR